MIFKICGMINVKAPYFIKIGDRLININNIKSIDKASDSSIRIELHNGQEGYILHGITIGIFTKMLNSADGFVIELAVSYRISG
jgi:hypothetical protein